MLWILAIVAIRFRESLHFLNITFVSSPVEKELNPCALFFSYFPAELFEFGFNPRYGIRWSPGHLDRVH